MHSPKKLLPVVSHLCEGSPFMLIRSPYRKGPNGEKPRLRNGTSRDAVLYTADKLGGFSTTRLFRGYRRTIPPDTLRQILSTLLLEGKLVKLEHGIYCKPGTPIGRILEQEFEEEFWLLCMICAYPRPMRLIRMLVDFAKELGREIKPFEGRGWMTRLRYYDLIEKDRENAHQYKATPKGRAAANWRKAERDAWEFKRLMS